MERATEPSFRFSRLAFLASAATVGAALLSLLASSIARGALVPSGLAAAGLLALLVTVLLYALDALPPRSGPSPRKARSRYGNLVNSAPWGIHMYELRGQELVFLGANPAAERILGVEMAPLVGKSIEAAFPPLAKTEVPARYRRAALTGDEWHTEEISYEHGQLRGAYEVHAFQTAPGEMAATFLDITERKRAAAAIQHERDFGNLLIDSIPGPFFLVDASLGLERWNRVFEQATGYSGEELRQLALLDFVPEADRAHLLERCQQVLTGAPAAFECRWRSKLGQTTPFHLTLVRLEEEGRRLLLGIALDLTELRKVERERDRLFNYSLDMLCIAGFDGFFKQLNPAWSALGWSQEMLLSRPWYALVHPEDRERTDRILAKLREGGQVRAFENRYRRADGSYRWLSWSSFPLPEERIILAVVRDVTEAKERELELVRYRDQLEDRVLEKTAELERAQQELIVKERQALLGSLTAAVSHELLNPLSVIRASLFTVARKVGGRDTALDRALARAERHILRCDEIVDQLVAFAHAPGLELELTDLDRWLEGELAGLELPESVELSRRLESGARLPIDREALHRVLVSLVANAVQAMEGLPPGLPRRLHLATVRSEQWVELRLQDSGPGIPAELLDKLFEPLFSTRKFGVGLGLPIARLVIEQHGGTIALSSEPGRGAVVTVLLPLPEERADERAAHPGG